MFVAHVDLAELLIMFDGEQKIRINARKLETPGSLLTQSRYDSFKDEPTSKGNMVYLLKISPSSLKLKMASVQSVQPPILVKGHDMLITTTTLIKFVVYSVTHATRGSGC